MTPFLSLLETFNDNEFKTLTITPDWAQGRATFGGLVAALLFKAAENATESDRSIRKAQITFVGPIAADEPVDFETTVLRAGGSATTVECKAVQKGQVQATMIASFGKKRESSHIVEPDIHRPEYPAPDQLEIFPYIEGVTPNFTQHYRLTWAEGSPPFSGDKSREMGGWVKMVEHNHPAGEAELLGLIDAWPPIAIQMLDDFAPVSTLNWSVQFIQDLPELSTEDWFQYHVTAKQGADGYSNTLAHFWDQNGQLLAISSQTVAVFA